MEIKYGCTRIAIVGKKRVYKVPNFTYSWNHFLKGLIANMGERDTWRWNSGQYDSGNGHLLCPVLWCSWGGWLLVMPRVDMVRHEAEIRELDEDADPYKKWKEVGFGGDDKANNYGYYQDRLVKIDYGQ